MNHIDLALAVNYIPACSCTMRLLFFLLVFSVMSVYENKQYFVVLGIILYLDRVVHRSMNIFDSNAVLSTVFFAIVYQYMRKSSDELNFTVLLVYFVWALVALVFQYDRGILLQWVNMVPFAQHLVETHLTGAVLLYLLYHPAQKEPYGCVVGKCIVFDIVVIAWIYIVGIKASFISNVHINNKWMIRYLPIIVLPLWMSVLFTVASVALLLLHFKHFFLAGTASATSTASTTSAASVARVASIASKASIASTTSAASVASKASIASTTSAASVARVASIASTASVASANTCKHEMLTIQEEYPEDTDDIEAMFKLAKQAAAK